MPNAKSARPNTPCVSACILAGGLSSRMGQDKARLRLGRRSLLGQIQATARAASLRVRVIRKDIVARCGPLGGVYTGLRAVRADAVLFLSCDMPFVNEIVLRGLVGRLTPKADAVFTEHDGRFGFPFLIRREALAVVEGMLERKELSLQRLAQLLQARPFRVPRKLAPTLFNVNTPDEYARAREQWAQTR